MALDWLFKVSPTSQTRTDYLLSLWMCPPTAEDTQNFWDVNKNIFTVKSLCPAYNVLLAPAGANLYCLHSAPDLCYASTALKVPGTESAMSCVLLKDRAGNYGDEIVSAFLKKALWAMSTFSVASGVTVKLPSGGFLVYSFSVLFASQICSASKYTSLGFLGERQIGRWKLVQSASDCNLQ